MKAILVIGEVIVSCFSCSSNYATSFVKLSTAILENGGKVVDLDEPKLTHIIIDKGDDSRRLELMKRTAKSVIFSLYLRHT